MNVVWQVTALFGSAFALWGYFRYGRLATREKAIPAMNRGEELPSKKLTPFPIMVAKGTCHCGSGCCIGDILAEWLVSSLRPSRSGSVGCRPVTLLGQSIYGRRSGGSSSCTEL